MVITGIIRPPPDIRAVVDRTALFVSKNGRAFEQRILNSAKGKTPKFAFLYDSSPFHAYYESRIRFYEDGGEEAEAESSATNDQQHQLTTETTPLAAEEGTKIKPDQDGDAVEAKAVGTATKAQKANIDPVSRELLAQRSIIVSKQIQNNKEKESAKTSQDDNKSQETPPVHHHQHQLQQEQIIPPATQTFVHITAPSNVTPSQLEIMKLTAQFAAFARLIPNESTVSNTFLDTLRFREWKNQQTFGFLHARHAHFAYFTALVDGYKRLLQAYYSNDKTDSSDMVVVVPLKTQEIDAIQQSLQERDVCARKGISGCLSVAAYRAEYNRYKIAEEAKRARELASGERVDSTSRLGGAAIIDWHDFMIVETIDFPLDEVVSALPPPPPLPKVQSAPKETVEIAKEEQQEMYVSEEEEEEEGEQLKIVSEYKPRVVATTTTAELSRTHMVDPITGKSIPVSDLSEHMRIQLLDPKWAEEKKRFHEKQRESNLLQGEDIARNVSRFAKQRGDVFGVSVRIVVCSVDCLDCGFYLL